MPLYEYECKECGIRVEVIHAVDEDRPEHCPKCKGKLKRLLGVPGLIFKGSGFYVNDYARKSTATDKSKGSEERAEGACDSKAPEATRDATDEPRKEQDAAAGTGT